MSSRLFNLNFFYAFCTVHIMKVHTNVVEPLQSKTALQSNYIILLQPLCLLS